MAFRGNPIMPLTSLLLHDREKVPNKIFTKVIFSFMYLSNLLAPLLSSQRYSYSCKTCQPFQNFKGV